MSTRGETLSLTGLRAQTRSDKIDVAMKELLNINYKRFEDYVVTDSEASLWMLKNAPLVLKAEIPLGLRTSLIGMLNQRIMDGKNEIQEMNQLKSILEERITKTNKTISYLHSNSQNVNELIPKYSLLQLVELEQMLRYNIYKEIYPPDMIHFVTNLLPQLRLEIKAKMIEDAPKVIDAAVAKRLAKGANEGGFKRSANTKKHRNMKSRKTKTVMK